MQKKEEEETQKSEGMDPSLKNWTHHGGEGAGGFGGRAPGRTDTPWDSAAICRAPIQSSESRIPRGPPKQPSSSGLLCIPHILYAQLKRNNQGNEQGRSRAAMPHTGVLTGVETAPPDQPKLVQGPRGLWGMRGRQVIRTKVSFCVPGWGG